MHAVYNLHNTNAFHFSVLLFNLLITTAATVIAYRLNENIDISVVVASEKALTL